MNTLALFGENMHILGHAPPFTECVETPLGVQGPWFSSETQTLVLFCDMSENH